MTTKIEFTDNYEDLSTERGFRFAFFCERCGTGFRSRFQPFALGTIAEALDLAGSLFGGVLDEAAEVGERVHSAKWETAHDEAFLKAAEEVRGAFIQCPKCTQWVCREHCWNAERGLCKECAPKVGVEMAAAQAQKTADMAWEQAEVPEEDRALLESDVWEGQLQAACPKCHAPLPPQAKFCPACGEKVASPGHCPACGARLPAGARYCPECGHRLG